MPLIPVVKETGRAKSLDELSDEEQLSWVEQCLTEQLTNSQQGWPIDSAALARAESFAQGDQPLLDRIAVARSLIAKGSQPVTQPALQLRGAKP